jgi:fructose-specific phosphotransferase system IIC component
MKRNQFLAAVSAVQLCFGLGGMALAVRRHHAFDLPFWHGQESAVGRDSLLAGTALSAPAAMLGAQAGATAVLLWRPKVGAARLLGGLGAAMVAGYLAERLVRRRLLPSGWDAVESSVVVAGMSLAAVMAVAGLRFQRPGREAVE